MSDTGASYDTAHSFGAIPESQPAPATQTASSRSSTHNYGQALTLVGGAVSAYATYEAGKDNEAVHRFNAEQARIQASQAIQAGDFAISEREARERYIEGVTRAGFASQGVVVGAGTSAAVLRNEANVSAMDKMMIGLNARRQAYGHQAMAIDQERQGKAAMLKGETGAVATLLNTENQWRLEGDTSYTGARYSKGVGE